LLVYYHEDQCGPNAVAEQGIYVIGADGSGRRLIRHTSEEIEFPAFSRTGEFVAYNGDLGVVLIIRVPGPRERPIGYSCYGDPPCQRLDFPRYLQIAYPAWSSTGRLALAFGDGVSGHIGVTTPRDPPRRHQFVTNLVTRSQSDSKPDWSPRARRIVFYRWRVRNDLHSHSNVFVARANGRGRPRRLTKSLDASFPVWSPNDRKIAYVRASNDPDEFVGSLWTMRASDGGGKRLVASRIDADAISWQPRPRR
jgi:hypothetical protein